MIVLEKDNIVLKIYGLDGGKKVYRFVKMYLGLFFKKWQEEIFNFYI